MAGKEQDRLHAAAPTAAIAAPEPAEQPLGALGRSLLPEPAPNRSGVFFLAVVSVEPTLFNLFCDLNNFGMRTCWVPLGPL